MLAMPGCGLLINLCLAAALEPVSEPGMRRGIIFLILITALFAAFLIAIALLTISRGRSRREALKKRRADPKLVDAWKEAGQRLEL